MIRILKYGEVENREIFARPEYQTTVTDTVAEIIRDVRKRGDEALFEYEKKFDKAGLSALRVSEDEIAEAVSSVEPEFLRVLRKAAANIRAFHEKQKREGFSFRNADGALLGQKILPVEKVGLYVPGGTASYPSTVLMDSIPAKIAGCREIVMVTPPDRSGKINPVILAAASIAGVDKIFKLGGAQAIAALAYGTESVPQVYKIVGPGNAYVAEAKRQVFGTVSIDMIAGPSEILIVADGKQNPAFAACDLLSQAEHDKNASAVLITDSEELANNVAAEIEKQIPALLRADIARASVDTNGKIIVAKDLENAYEIANEIAPEHLELCVEHAEEALQKIQNAGSVFLGRNTPEALGDYYAGPNHTLPTSGTAKFSSPLSVDDFIKKTQFICYTEEALDRVSGDVFLFAEKEGLTGHAKSAVIRTESRK